MKLPSVVNGRLAGETPALPGRLAAMQGQGDLAPLSVEMQDQLDVLEPMQQAGMDDVHEVGKIQRTFRARGPAAFTAEEFTSSAVPQQSLDRVLEIHGLNLPQLRENPNGVNPEDVYHPRFTIDARFGRRRAYRKSSIKKSGCQLPLYSFAALC